MSFSQTPFTLLSGLYKASYYGCLAVRARYPACTAPHANEGTPLSRRAAAAGSSGCRRVLSSTGHRQRALWGWHPPVTSCGVFAVLLKPTKTTRSDTNPSTPESASTRVPCTSRFTLQGRGNLMLGWTPHVCEPHRVPWIPVGPVGQPWCEDLTPPALWH